MIPDQNRPLVVFDLETTGTDVDRDRITEISANRINSSGEVQTLQFYVNPEMPISVEASEITKITDEMVKDCPTFKTRAQEIKDFISGCDLAGYNIIQFDVPLLRNEFIRAGVEYDMEGVRVLDAFAIFCKLVPRSLAGAVKFFLGKDMDLERAHGAGYDVEMTTEVLQAQLANWNHGNIWQTIDDVHDYCNPDGAVDISRKLIRNSKGEVCWNFGKHKGKPIWYDSGYYIWFMQGNFPAESRKQAEIAMEIRNKAIVKNTPASIPLN